MCHKVFEDEMSVLRHQMQAHRTEETASAAAAAAVAASGASALTSVAVAAAAVAAAAAASSSDASCSTTEANGVSSEAAKVGPGVWHTQYKCSYCEESFKRPLELERHVRVHFSSQVIGASGIFVCSTRRPQGVDRRSMRVDVENAELENLKMQDVTAGLSWK